MNTKNEYLVALIDKAAIVHNCKILRALAGPNVRFCPAVKCNAYGHGVEIVLPAIEQAGAEMVAVASIAEAQQVLDLGWKRDILLLGSEFSVYSDNQKQQLADWLIENNIHVTATQKQDITALANAAQKIGKKAFVHAALDSGMTRMGLAEDALSDLVDQIQNNQYIQLKGLYTHFATADEFDKTFANQQLARFDNFLNSLKQRGIHVPLIHAANSAALIDIPASRYNMVRPGISVYGYQPSGEMLNRPELKPCMKLVSYLSMVKKIKAGSYVGYGRTWQAKKDTVTAIVPIGYGDGYNRRLTNIGKMSIAGHLVPVIGRVSMDLTILDVTSLVEKGLDIRPGVEVTIIDNHPKAANSVESIAAELGTIPYDITTGLGQRVIRKST